MQILHPMLPIFMLSEALSIILDLNDDDELREDYYYYYIFLTKIYIYIKQHLPRIHFHHFGLFLRELLFYNNIPITNKSFSSITHQLTNFISGNIIQPDYIYSDSHNHFKTIIGLIINDTYVKINIPKMNFIKIKNNKFKLSMQKEFNTSS